MLWTSRAPMEKPGRTAANMRAKSARPMKLAIAGMADIGIT